MRSVDEIRAHLQTRVGVKWNDDYERRSKFRRSTNTVEDVLQLLNGETYFFRYPIYLQILRGHLIRHALQNPGAPFRVCSAGCSTGEEAYSIAFSLSDFALKKGCRLEVIGLDVRPDAIRAAKTGHYRDWSLRNYQPHNASPFLLKNGERWEVLPKYKKVVDFQVQNLLEGLAFEPVQAVVVCNVLLYMHEAAVARVYNNLTRIMDPGAILLIAPTDPPPGDSWILLEECAGWPAFSRTRYQKQSRKNSVFVHSGKKQISKDHLSSANSLKQEMPDPLNSAQEEDLWKAWARGELKEAREIVRRKLFFEPQHPLWRFLNGVILWENGWLRKSTAEMEKARGLLTALPEDQVMSGLCTAGELQTLISFWRERHG
jgi:Methylase of chemotaxis methyl-accepting proteins